MSDETNGIPERVGFRDIYTAVEGAEKRIKEHISLALVPILSQIAEQGSALKDHEARIRTIETQGSDEARAALAATVLLDARVTVVEAARTTDVAAGVERRRLADLSGRAIAGVVLVSNFVLGLVIMFANLITDHSK